MNPRRHRAHFHAVSAGPIPRRRAARGSRRDFVLLAGGLILIAAALFAAHLAPARERTGPVVAAAARVPREGPSPTAAGHPHPLRSDAAPSLPPPFTWDYRWLAAHPALGAPPLHTRAAILVGLEDRRVLFDVDPHASLAMASTTKLMTAMVALDNATPDTVLTVPPDVANLEGDGTMMGLTPGETVPVQDLLYGLLLDSGNDAAETLAAGTLGRQDFIAAMNRRARRLGLAETHFVNPSGLDDPDQRSSAHDLAIIAATLYQRYPALEQVVTTRTLYIPSGDGHKAFQPMNFDKMLWQYPGAIGFKTGNTDDAGLCLVTGARRGDRTLIAVLLDDPLIFTDAKLLLDYGFAREAGIAAASASAAAVPPSLTSIPTGH